jgi:hypothetical protein
MPARVNAGKAPSHSLKLSSVAANELGVTGRTLLSALIAGTSNADELANWRADGCATSCLPALPSGTNRALSAEPRIFGWLDHRPRRSSDEAMIDVAGRKHSLGTGGATEPVLFSLT